MNDELFNEADIAGLSPRRAWMNRHEICFAHSAQGVGLTSPESGDEVRPWLAWKQRVHDECAGPANSAQGDTLDEALAALAIKLGLKLWNEEDAEQ